MTKKSLYPRKEVEVDYKLLILFITLFAVIFFILGSVTAHYPSIQGVI